MHEEIISYVANSHLLISQVLDHTDKDLVHEAIELSDCPCDPRRRHERLAQKVAVV